MTTAVVLATAAEARARAARIRSHFSSAHHELLTAQEGEDWRALGYKSFERYCVAEFGLKRRNAYYQLDRAKVERALSEATGAPVTITAGAARQVVTHLTSVHNSAQLSVAAGMAPQAAAEHAVEHARLEPVRVVASERVQWADDFASDETPSLRCPKCGYEIGRNA